MEQFDHLEAAQEVALILKAGDTNRAAAFLRKLAEDFSGAAFAADLREEKDFYAEALDLPVTDIEWMACTLEGNAKPSLLYCSFNTDELCELDYALANLIQDKTDYCANEEGTAEHIQRLNTLRAKLAALIAL